MPRAKKTATEPKTATPEGTEKMPSFEIVEAVTLPTLKWPQGETIFVKFEKAIEIRQTVDPQNGEEKEIEVATVRELTTDSQHELVCGVVLKKELDMKYENDGYVGACFKMTKHKVPNKRYNTFEIYKIKLND